MGFFDILGGLVKDAANSVKDYTKEIKEEKARFAYKDDDELFAVLRRYGLTTDPKSVAAFSTLKSRGYEPEYIKQRVLG